MAPSVKRKYDSTRRQEQARATQGLIAAAARDLFVERGYAATSVRDIAEAAGVAVQTIYNAFDGGKPAILARVVDIAVVGDDEPIALAERAEVRAALETSDPRDVVTRWARYSTAIAMRMLHVYPVMTEAANVEPEIAQLRQRNYVENRWLSIREVAAHLRRLKALPRGLPVDRATDLMYAYSSIEAASSLIVERGWSPDQFAAWTADMFCRLFEID